jgi:type II secretory pathway component PulK
MVNDRRRGVALIFVLWLLVLLGVAAAEIATRARSEAEMVASIRARAVGQYAAESGILLASTEIETLLDSAPNPQQRAVLFHRLDSLNAIPHDIDVGAGRVGVAVIDLNARLDLNRTDTTTLRALFSQFARGADPRDLVRALKREPVSRFPELARVPGIDDALAIAVAPYVTTWSDGDVNVNTAPAPVLTALGVGKAGIQSIMDHRARGEVLTSTDGLRGGQTGAAVAVDAPLLTLAPTRLMLVARGWQPGAPLTHEIQAVYVIVGTALVLQSWEERDR